MVIPLKRKEIAPIEEKAEVVLEELPPVQEEEMTETEEHRLRYLLEMGNPSIFHTESIRVMQSIAISMGNIEKSLNLISLRLLDQNKLVAQSQGIEIDE